MTARRFFAAVLVAVLGACSQPISESELAARTQAASPKWQSYQEDIKGQIGAGPVAQWRGEPVEAVHEPPALRLTFSLSGPWVGREAVVPLLVRDPVGQVHQNSSASRQQHRVAYEFNVTPANSESRYPWVEVKFPNGSKRIVFNSNGIWKPAPTP